MVRLAIIGLGHIGKVHVEAIAECEGVNLVAACDQDTTLSEIVPQGIDFYADHYALLANGGFDTVIVATPNRTHNAIAHDVLNAGYHVIVEKPAAGCMDELEALELLAAEKGRQVYFAFHAALAFEMSWLKEHLQEARSRYGDLTAFLCRFYDPYINSSGQILPHAYSLGDCWSDSGVNALSVLERLLSVEYLHVVGRRQSGGSEATPIVLSTSVHFSFPVSGYASGGFGLIETAWDQGVNHKSTELYFGSSGWRLVADHSAQMVVSHAPDGTQEILVSFEGERLLNHYRGLFADYIRCAKASSMNGMSARKVHEKLFEVTAFASLSCS